jgi:hypothetical protein
MRKRAYDGFDAAFDENGRDYDWLKFVRSFGLARRDVVAGRRDADILFEILLSERPTRKLVGGGRHPQHRWWPPMRRSWCGWCCAVEPWRRSMARGTTCAVWVHPMPGCPSLQLYEAGLGNICEKG